MNNNFCLDELTSPAPIRTCFWSTTPTFWRYLFNFPPVGAVKEVQGHLFICNDSVLLTTQCCTPNWYVLVHFDRKNGRCTLGSNSEGMMLQNMKILLWLDCRFPMTLQESASKAKHFFSIFVEQVMLLCSSFQHLEPLFCLSGDNSSWTSFLEQCSWRLHA